MAPNTTPSSGNASPTASVLDAPLASVVHPTAARRPVDAITVQGENTIYSDEYITSTFHNRGADVVVQEGARYVIKPTVTHFEFRTQRKVPKTGYVVSRTRTLTLNVILTCNISA
jgi:myo-inositol-1-phosphate synthase